MLGKEVTYDYGKEYWNEYIKPKGCLCPKCTEKSVKEKSVAIKKKEKVMQRRHFIDSEEESIWFCRRQHTRGDDARLTVACVVLKVPHRGVHP